MLTNGDISVSDSYSKYYKEYFRVKNFSICKIKSYPNGSGYGICIFHWNLYIYLGKIYFAIGKVFKETEDDS